MLQQSGKFKLAQATVNLIISRSNGVEAGLNRRFGWDCRWSLRYHCYSPVRHCQNSSLVISQAITSSEVPGPNLCQGGRAGVLARPRFSCLWAHSYFYGSVRSARCLATQPWLIQWSQFQSEELHFWLRCWHLLYQYCIHLRLAQSKSAATQTLALVILSRDTPHLCSRRSGGIRAGLPSYARSWLFKSGDLFLLLWSSQAMVGGQRNRSMRWLSRQVKCPCGNAKAAGGRIRRTRLVVGDISSRCAQNSDSASGQQTAKHLVDLQKACCESGSFCSL